MSRGKERAHSLRAAGAGDASGLPGVVRALDENLATLAALLRALLALSEDKLGALRRADTAALQHCAGREVELLEEVYALERTRQAILARAAQLLPAIAGGAPRLRDLLGALPEPLASVLRARNAGLQELAGKLRQQNQLAARVAQNLQHHIRAVFAELARATQESMVYNPKGQPEQTRLHSCVDAVG